MTPVEAYFQVLVAMARADGSLHEEEVRIIRAALDGLRPTDEVRDAVEAQLDPSAAFDVPARLEEAAASLDPSTLAETLRDAYVVAYIDGRVHEVELGVVEQLFGYLGIPPEEHPPLHEWARRAAEHHVEGLELIAEVMPRAG